MTTSFFHFSSPFVSWKKVENHDEIKQKWLQPIVDDYEKNKNTLKKLSSKTWDEDCCTSSIFGKDTTSYDLITDILDDNLVSSTIWESYYSMLDGLLKTDKISKIEYEEYHNAVLDDLWYNYYEIGEYQEAHNHDTCLFSGVYVLDDLEPNNTYWFNENPVFGSDTKNCFRKSNSRELGIGEGYILFFPSRLPHYVPSVKNKKITLSFNFDYDRES